jgi:hypothetical protein
MLTTPIHPFLRPHIERRLDDVIQPTEAWRLTEPYKALVAAERTASQISSIGFVPGTLRSEGYLEATNWALQRGDRAMGEQQFELVLARQQMMDLRQATGELTMRVVMPANIMRGVLEEMCLEVPTLPGRNHDELAMQTVRDQAQRLLLACHNGWDIKLVPDGELRKALGSQSVTSVLCEGMPNQTPGVYQQVRPVPGMPHERWDADHASVENHAEQFELLAAHAMPEHEMLDVFQSWAHTTA